MPLGKPSAYFFWTEGLAGVVFTTVSFVLLLEAAGICLANKPKENKHLTQVSYCLYHS
jgi:hypothetical protein